MIGSKVDNDDDDIRIAIFRRIEAQRVVQKGMYLD